MLTSSLLFTSSIGAGSSQPVKSITEIIIIIFLIKFFIFPIYYKRQNKKIQVKTFSILKYLFLVFTFFLGCLEPLLGNDGSR